MIFKKYGHFKTRLDERKYEVIILNGKKVKFYKKRFEGGKELKGWKHVYDWLLGKKKL